jgi:hypothetical protein
MWPLLYMNENKILGLKSFWYLLIAFFCWKFLKFALEILLLSFPFVNISRKEVILIPSSEGAHGNIVVKALCNEPSNKSDELNYFYQFT